MDESPIDLKGRGHTYVVSARYSTTRSASTSSPAGKGHRVRRLLLSERRSVRVLAGRTAAGLVVAMGAWACGSALSTPADAVGSDAASFGPHAAVSVTRTTASAPSTPLRAQGAVAQLTLANVVVADLATRQGYVYSYDNPAPAYQGSYSGAPCNSDPNAYVCLSFGSGGNGGYFFIFGGGPYRAGTTFTDASASIGVAAQGTVCDINHPGYAAYAQLDQYVATSNPFQVQSVAVQFECADSSVGISGTIAFNIVPTTAGNGYYMFGQQGEITGFGNDHYLSYLDGAQYYSLNAPIVGMAAAPDGGGYWMVGADGGVFSGGDAQFFGSTGNLHLNKPVVGMTATPDGRGYWFVATDGGIFAYGDARFYGSTGNLHLNKPVVGMTATPDGRGYWLVASDGGIFAYGDARFYGSTGNIRLNKPIVGMTATPDGQGYWFVATDGGIFAYGDAQFHGSLGGLGVDDVAGMSTGV